MAQVRFAKSKNGAPFSLAALIIFVLVAIAYANAFKAGFLLDDLNAIRNNQTIRNLADLPQVFSPPLNTTVSGRPLVNLTLALDYALGGIDTRINRATNILVHFLCCLLLLLFIRRTLTSSVWKDRFARTAWPTAFAASVVWAVHPIQTESVTYLIQRAESLAALFYLGVLLALSISAYSRWPKLWLALAVLSCFLGALTKETISTAPILAVLYDRVYLAGSFAGVWKKRGLFYLCLAASWLPLAYLVASCGGRGAACGFDGEITVASYASIQLVAIAKYLGLLFWPNTLVLDYGQYFPSQTATLFSGVLLAGLLVLTAWGLKKKPEVAFWGAWFFVILAPSSSIIPVSTQTMALHRTYLASAAPIVLTVLLFDWFLRRPGMRIDKRLAWLAVGLLVLPALVWRTILRNADYAHPEVIWQEALRENPTHFRAMSQLGALYLDNGRPADAAAILKKALELAPNDSEARNMYAVALSRSGPPQTGEAMLLDILARDPGNVKALINLGDRLDASGDWEGAVGLYARALTLDPQNSNAHNNMGVALMEKDKGLRAIAHFEEAVKADPGFLEARNNLGAALTSQGRYEEALGQYREALKLDPGYAMTLRNMAAVLTALGRADEARVYQGRAAEAKR